MKKKESFINAVYEVALGAEVSHNTEGNTITFKDFYKCDIIFDSMDFGILLDIKWRSISVFIK